MDILLWHMPVALPLFIISQVVGVCALACLFCQYQMKSKVKILWIFALANVFYTLACILLFDWVGVGVNGLAIIRNIVFIVLLIKKDRIPLWVSVAVLASFLASAAIIMVFVWNYWFNWVVLAGQFLLYYGCWCKSAHRMRICHSIFALIYIYHCYYTSNWVHMAAEAMAVVSVILFYSRAHIKKLDIARIKTAHTFDPFVTRIVTAESVNIGHPDKTCDVIADSFLDAALAQDPSAQMAVECAIKNDHLFIYGEATTTAKINYEKIARDVLKDIGYTCEFKITKVISEQSPEINAAVKNVRPCGAPDVENGELPVAANDQGFVYGYAVNETPELTQQELAAGKTPTLMPLPIMLAHKLMRQYDEYRKTDPRFFPDAKCQVSIEYNKKKVLGVHTILISVSHAEGVTHDEIENVIRDKVIDPVMDNNYLPIYPIINPSGAFTVWGSFSDSGCVGRKIVVDTYGGAGRVGGGCFSSKNSTKVDRSAAYYARYAAKNVVAKGMADECEIQVSYGIGLTEPISIYIETFGTHKVERTQIEQYVKDNFNFTPSNIIKELDLNRPIYKDTACFGHFGRSEFPWEQIKQTVKQSCSVE